MKTVIKEVPVKFNSKKEFAMALIEGRRFKCEGLPSTVYWDCGKTNPFRYGYVQLEGAWEAWGKNSLVEVIEEEVKWEYELKNKPNGILCFVWNHSAWKNVRIVDRFTPDTQFPYMTGSTSLTGPTGWEHAVPLTKEEVLELCYED